MEEKVEAFIAALSKLSREHGLWVGACGCCRSPYVQAATDATGYDFRLGDGTAQGDEGPIWADELTPVSDNG